VPLALALLAVSACQDDPMAPAPPEGLRIDAARQASMKGRMLFASNRDGDSEIYVMNADGTQITQLTFHDAGDHLPDWLGNDKAIVFESTRSGVSFDIYRMNADGSGVTPLTTHPAFDGHPASSGNGKRIAFVSNREGPDDIFIMNSDGSGKTNVTQNPAADQRPGRPSSSSWRSLDRSLWPP
jgi:Tol biopolymer transport system component